MQFNKGKKLVTRALSAGLASLMLFTSVPLDAQASAAAIAGAAAGAAAGASGAMGDNGQGTVSTGVANSYPGTGWVDTRQGYRFYMVDSSCNRVSDVYDFLFETPQGVGKMFTNSRYEAPSSDLSYWHQYTISALANEWCAGAVGNTDIMGIYPLLILKSVHGADFQKWFIGIRGQGGGGGSSSVGTVRPVQAGRLPAENNKYVVAGVFTVDGSRLYNITEEVDCVLGWGQEMGLSNDERKSYIQTEYSNYVNSYTINMAATYSSQMKKIYNDTYNSMSGAVGSVITWEGTKTESKVTNSDIQKYAYYEAYNQVMGGLMYTNTDTSRAIQNMAQYLFDGGSTSTLQSMNKKAPAASEENGRAPVVGDIMELNTIDITQNIPLSGADYPADIMLKRAEFKVYGFGEDVDGDGMVTAMDALKYKDAEGNYVYYLVVEPLAWINLFSSSTSPQSYRTYGSYYNLVEEMSKLGNDNASGPHSSYFKQYGKNSLQVNKTYEEMINPIRAKETDARLTISQSLAAMQANIGYGMHVYCAGDLESGTSTFDEPLGDNPGPAPDDSPMLSETERTNPRQHANIVKFYESYVGDNLDFSDSFNREVTPKMIQIEDEISYKVSDWFTSPTYRPAGGPAPKYDDYKGSLSNTQTGQTPTSVELATETTLYVLLVKLDDEDPGEPEKGDWIINESQLTKHAKTTNTDKGADVLSTHEFVITYPGLDKTHGDCYCDEGGWHERTDPETGEDRSYSCSGCSDSSRSRGDTSVEIIWKNDLKETYKKLMSTREDETWGEKWNKHYEGDRTSLDEEKDKLTGVTYDFLLHRAGYDNTMIYTGKAINNTLGAIKTSIANTVLTSNFGFKQGTIGSPTKKNGGKVYNISLKFVDDKAKSDNETSSVCDRCDDTSKNDGTTLKGLQINGEVAINTYFGISSSTKNNSNYNPAEVMYIGTNGYNKTAGRMIAQGKTFRFVPYVQMRFDNISTEDQETFAVGQYERAMTVNDYAEVAWNTAAVGNLHVTSNQWSAHAGAMDLSRKLLGNAIPNIMLPGGALYSLDTKGSEQEIQVSTYQTVLLGPGLEQVQYRTGQDLSQLQVSEAKAAHEDFVESVIGGLTAIPVKQYVDKDADGVDATNGIHVYPGADISRLNNGSSKASTDSKYYFVDDAGSGANENDLDAWITNPGTPKFFTFYTNTKGEIRMAEVNESGSTVGSDVLLIPKGGSISSLSNQTAIAINNRTLIVEKLIDAVERNTGNDSDANWVSDGHWYNEAFNGVTVMVQQTKLKVGFYDPALRTTVLDPKLIPQQTSKGTIFQKAFSSQFETSDTSGAFGKPNVVGVFKGKEIQMRDMQFLFQSNVFFIPDANVQDLS